MLVLGAYAPDLRSGRNGGAHALSNAATGFSGIVQLARATGRNPLILRNEQFSGYRGSRRADSGKRGDGNGPRCWRGGRPGRPWSCFRNGTRCPIPRVPGWVRARGLRPVWDPQRVLAPAHPLRGRSAIAAAAEPLRDRSRARPGRSCASPRPGPLQTVGGPGLKPIVTDEAGRAVLVQFGSQPFYLLADPDLLSNRGMADRRQAASGARHARLPQLDRGQVGHVRRHPERPRPEPKPACG